MFHKCQSNADAKKLFRRLALRLHPDAGGEADLMILLQEHYDNTFPFIEELEKRRKEEYRSPPEKYQKTYEDVESPDERLSIIEEILAYAKTHKKFDPSMTESFKEYLEEHGYITSSQYNTLVKVYYAFRMDRKKETP